MGLAACLDFPDPPSISPAPTRTLDESPGALSIFEGFEGEKRINKTEIVNPPHSHKENGFSLSLITFYS